MSTTVHDRFYKELGQRLRIARQQRGFTQGQVAASISLERTSISNIESGRQRLPIHTLCEYCSLLGVPLANVMPELVASEPVAVNYGEKCETQVVPGSVAEVIKRRFSDNATVDSL